MGIFSGTTKHVILVVLALSFTGATGDLIFSGISREAGRVLTESSIDSTVRIDPSDHLKKYRGGFNVTNSHYWSSIIFTGISGYVVAIIWLLCGLVFGILLLVRTRCCMRSRKSKNISTCHEKYHLQPLLLAVFFTILALAASGLALGGNATSHSRAKKVIDIILDTAEDASMTIFKITGAMRQINSSLTEVGGNDHAIKLISSTTVKLDNQAKQIQTQAIKNRFLIQETLESSKQVIAVTVALTLIVVISLLASGVLKFQRLLQVLIAVCWILLVFCWLFFGICFFLLNLTGDTCKALEGFRKNPYNNSLSSLLPCQQLLSAKPTLNNVSSEIHNLVNKVNVNISVSYGNVVQVCNPFGPPPIYEYQPSNCPPTAVQIGEIPNVLKQLACPDSQTSCIGGIFIPEKYYKSIGAYCNSIQLLLNEYPGIKSLVECQPVKDVLTEILDGHCKPLRKYIKLLWLGFLFLSLVLVPLILIWVFRAHHDHMHHSSGGSIEPQNGGGLESGAAND